MKYLIIPLIVIAFNFQLVYSDIVDVNQSSEYTIEVTTGSGKSNLSNIVNGSCKLSGFNSKYIVVSCAGTQINIYKENGEFIRSISNAIYPEDSHEPKYVSNVTDRFIIVKYRKGNRKDYYDFDANYVKCEDC